MKATDLTGKKFGKLTVTGQAESSGEGKEKKARWNCVCECGGTSVVQAYNLNSGNSKSCGCARIRRGSDSHFFKHGETESAEFNSWKELKNKCYNIGNKQYVDYGGRGITVCPRWLESYENFINDMGDKPSSIHSIDRADNDKGYEYSNCYWATPTQQANNRRSSRYITHEGKTLTLAEWARHLDIHYKKLWKRLKLGWTFADAINH